MVVPSCPADRQLAVRCCAVQTLSSWCRPLTAPLCRRSATKQTLKWRASGAGRQSAAGSQGSCGSLWQTLTRQDCTLCAASSPTQRCCRGSCQLSWCCSSCGAAVCWRWRGCRVQAILPATGEELAGFFAWSEHAAGWILPVAVVVTLLFSQHV